MTPDNIILQLAPYAHDAEAIAKASLAECDTRQAASQAALLAGLVLAAAAAEELGWRPAVLFARVALQGDVLFSELAQIGCPSGLAVL